MNYFKKLKTFGFKQIDNIVLVKFYSESYTIGIIGINDLKKIQNLNYSILFPDFNSKSTKPLSNFGYGSQGGSKILFLPKKVYHTFEFSINKNLSIIVMLDNTKYCSLLLDNNQIIDIKKVKKISEDQLDDKFIKSIISKLDIPTRRELLLKKIC